MIGTAWASEVAVGAADAAATHGGHSESFFATPEFWVAVAFLIMVGAAFKPILRVVTTALDARAAGIRGQIDEARRLRDEAQELLASYERKQRDASREADQIVERARREADRTREHASADLERALQRREQSALERIAQAEAAAVDEIRATAADVALTATQRLLAEKLSDARATAMVDTAIEDLPNKLH